MEVRTSQNKTKSISCTVNGFLETIYFSPFSMESERSPYQIKQEYGLDKSGKFSTSFEPFEKGTVEHLLIEFVKNGDVKALTDAGILLCERPTKGNISRNLALFDPETGMSYTVGGIGLIKPTDDDAHFILTDPLLDQKYGEYQQVRGNPAGGTKWFSDEGMRGSVNTSTVGTLEYNTGPYHAVRKSLENEKLKEKGLKCPDFIAAGPITNIADSKFGFTIYRSNLTPEYVLNLGLYADQSGNLKPNFFSYLQSKYAQLYHLHNELNESHGQPSVTNTLAEINLLKTENNLTCQIKDFETNQPIPDNKSTIITDGLSPVPTGWICKKSPHAAARIYDLQLSLLQEFNVLNATINRIENQQKRFNYITTESARILLSVCTAYSIASETAYKSAIEFAMRCFYEHLQRTGDFGCFNYIVSGAFAHKYFANSDLYGAEVEILKSRSELPSYVVKQ